MPYLNLDPDFFTHPKTVRLSGLIGPEAAIYPLRLWAYCAKFHPIDADLSAYSKGEIETAIGWRGESGKLVESLVRVGMLTVCNEHFCVHDWKEHQGHLEAFKIRGRLAAEARWAKLSKKKANNATSNALSNALSNAPALPAIPTNQVKNTYEIDFELARMAYPGKKRSHETEWRHFLSKNKNRLSEVIPLLLPAINRYRAQIAADKTEPKYIKHFQGWITAERWTEETPAMVKIERPHVPSF